MSTIKIGDIVVLIDQVQAGDEDGFVVLADVPDNSKTIPVKRVSDGEYQCLPIDFLKKKPALVKGRFYKTLAGRILFHPTDVVRAAKYGFTTSMETHDKYISNEIEVEVNL